MIGRFYRFSTVCVVVHVVLLLAETNALLFASEGLSNRMVFSLAIWMVLDVVMLGESRSSDSFDTSPPLDPLRL
jgi:hypothetical protein